MRPMLGGCQRPKTVSPCLEHTQVRLQKRKHAPRLRTNLFSHDKLHSECPLFQCQEISLNQTRANAKRPLYIRGERPQPQQQRIPHAPSESRQTCMGSFVAHSPDSRPRLDQFFSFSSPFIARKQITRHGKLSSNSASTMACWYSTRATTQDPTETMCRYLRQSL